ncbi:MAG: mechanosensitive ion channel family protein [Armatimonadota bacterium]|nr:mechanosensitive ion channel family protein [Armatimonadota bacterium]
MWRLDYLGNPLWLWGVSLLSAGLVAVAGLALRASLVRRLRARAEVDLVALSRRLVERSWLAILLLALRAGTAFLALPGWVGQGVSAVTTTGLFLQLGVWGNVATTWAVDREVRRRVTEDAAAATTLAALSYLARFALWTVLLLLLLDNLGVRVTALVAGLGIGGVAMALALQNVLGDLFASLAIALDKPFQIGDFIIVDQYLGTVEHIGLKTTRVRSLWGEQLVFSNNDLLQSRIRNFKRMRERRVVFNVAVVYQTPYEKLARIPQILREVVEQQPVRFDRAHFKEYGDSGLVFEVVYYVLNPDYTVYMDTQQAINLEVFRRFHQEGIEFAYPTRTVYVRPLGS